MSYGRLFVLAALSLTGCWPSGFAYIATDGSGPLDSGVEDSGLIDDASDGGGGATSRVDLVAMSQVHACARVTINGISNVYCWGKLQNNAGGSDTVEMPSQRSPALATKLTGSENTLRLALGDSFGCFSTQPSNNSAMYCWGTNISGQLGRDNSVPSSPTPLRAFSEASTFVLGESEGFAVGPQHGCAIDNSKLLWCWGAGSSGQRGSNDNGPPTAPTRFTTPDGNLVRVAAGNLHTCVESASTAVIASDGSMREARVFCFGDRGSMQTGYQNALHGGVPLTTPIWVDTGSVFEGTDREIIQLAAGGNNSCMLVRSRGDDSTALFCWGDSTFGQLGFTSPSALASPTFINAPMGGATWKPRSVAIGAGHICAIADDPTNPARRQLWCWGQNSRGQLATGSSSRMLSTTPIEIPLPASPTEVAAAGSTTCAIAGQKLYCWGDNTNGILGIGSEIDSASTPTEVTFR